MIPRYNTLWYMWNGHDRYGVYAIVQWSRNPTISANFG